MATLRRELRTKFEEVLHRGALWTKEKLAETLADAALELRGFALLQNAGPEWAMLADQPVTEEMTERENLRQTAPRMFEKALQFSKPLPWWNGKDWTAFGEWVCVEYEKDKSSFGRYNIWRNTKYNKGGITNQRLRGFPAEFYDSWDMFKMSENTGPVEMVEYL